MVSGIKRRPQILKKKCKISPPRTEKDEQFANTYAQCVAAEQTPPRLLAAQLRKQIQEDTTTAISAILATAILAMAILAILAIALALYSMKQQHHQTLKKEAGRL